jgi:hypothetical protein
VEVAISWNTGGLLAEVAGPSEWTELSQEALRERAASRRKLNWLSARIDEWKPKLLVLTEVTGHNGQMRRGIQAWLTKKGYTSQALAGEGGGGGSALSASNGVVIAVDPKHFAVVS